MLLVCCDRAGLLSHFLPLNALGRGTVDEFSRVYDYCTNISSDNSPEIPINVGSLYVTICGESDPTCPFVRHTNPTSSESIALVPMCDLHGCGLGWRDISFLCNVFILIRVLYHRFLWEGQGHISVRLAPETIHVFTTSSAVAIGQYVPADVKKHLTGGVTMVADTQSRVLIRIGCLAWVE